MESRPRDQPPIATWDKESLTLARPSVLLADFDPRSDFEYQRPQPEGDIINVQLGKSPEQVVKIGASLPEELRARFSRLLMEHADLFA